MNPACPAVGAAQREAGLQTPSAGGSQYRRGQEQASGNIKKSLGALEKAVCIHMRVHVLGDIHVCVLISRGEHARKALPARHPPALAEQVRPATVILYQSGERIAETKVPCP